MSGVAYYLLTLLGCPQRIAKRGLTLSLALTLTLTPQRIAKRGRFGAYLLEEYQPCAPAAAGERAVLPKP